MSKETIETNEELLVSGNESMDKKEIKEMITKIQEITASVTNKIDAFGREYESENSNGQIFLWTQAIDKTFAKVKKISRQSLIASGNPTTISLEGFNIDVKFSEDSISLDTTTFKKLDYVAYSFLAKKFPKVTKSRASIKVTAKKGVANV